jgi:SAM-dependent methyltransferase
MEPRGKELIARYKHNYGIPPEANITEAMILAHWDLERQLTAELLQSTPEHRWETFDRCYSRLYADLAWLNQFSSKAITTPPHKRFRRWVRLIGHPPQAIYEIGSGAGDLISFLAQEGFDCKGTEITRERGAKLMKGSHPNLSWGRSDGIHLDQFEPSQTYDVVVSDQVIEHMHPEDVDAHMKGAYAILKPGGRYIFCTPHKQTGPHDVSRVFKLDEPKGMHLKEYTYRELLDAAKRAGFSRAYYAFIPARLPTLLERLRAGELARDNRLGEYFLNLEMLIESLLAAMPGNSLRRLSGKALRKVYLFSDNISMVVEKAA